MMTRKDVDNRFQIEFNSVDALVPKNHLVRKIDKAIDFNFIYDEVAELYSAFGAPSIDPAVLIKIIMIQYLFGIPSMRQTIREIEVNIAYRWFIGYSFNEKIPHFSTFNKNYERRFKDTDLFNVIFTKILEEADKHGFINLSEIYIDSTHIKASANKRKYTKKEIETEAKKYQEQLEKEIDDDREKHDKKPLKKTEKSTDTKVVVESTTDKDSGMFYKNEKEKCFAYLAHTACDNNNYILDFHVTSGNVHDSVGFIDLYKSLKENHEITNILAIAMDAGYITPYICKTLFDDNILPTLPYKRPMTKDGFFKKYEYVYDEYNDFYVCPNDKILKYTTTNRDGYREYKSNPCECKNCPYISKCTSSKNHQKLVTRHVWEKYLEEANHLRHDRYVNSVYKCRKETIERVFADAKEKHSMRYTHLRGLAKMKMEVTLTFACMNLKKMANRLWKRRGSYRVDSTFYILIIRILINNILELTKSIFLTRRKCFLSTI
jgi:transposase